MAAPSGRSALSKFRNLLGKSAFFTQTFETNTRPLSSSLLWYTVSGKWDQTLVPRQTVALIYVNPRAFHTSQSHCCEATENETDKKTKIKKRIIPKFRRMHAGPKIDVEDSVRYMRSAAYFEWYGNKLVWYDYRRNYKGNTPPRPRFSCLQGNIVANNPCPICRNSNLTVGYKNVALLLQFMDHSSGHILSNQLTGVCRKQQKLLELSVQMARDYGYLMDRVEPKIYRYSDYYPQVPRQKPEYIRAVEKYMEDTTPKDAEIPVSADSGDAASQQSETEKSVT